jgi:hypothetical protein
MLGCGSVVVFTVNKAPEKPIDADTFALDVQHCCRRDHGQMELKVRAAHDQREASAEDLAALTGAQHFVSVSVT